MFLVVRYSKPCQCHCHFRLTSAFFICLVQILQTLLLLIVLLTFRTVKVLFFKEEYFPLKVAHALKKSSLNPNNVARTSPSHALSIKLCVSLLIFCDLFAWAFFHYSGIFSESTINSLHY